MNKKKHLKWHRKILAVVLVVLMLMGTLDASLFQTFAMDRQIICGMEEHQHDGSCYEEPKHIHTDSCFDAEGQYICGMESDVLHIHTQECFDSDANLICGLAPAVEEDTGIEEPQEKKEVLFCGKTEHEHTEECYEEVEEEERLEETQTLPMEEQSEEVQTLPMEEQLEEVQTLPMEEEETKDDSVDTDKELEEIDDGEDYITETETQEEDIAETEEKEEEECEVTETEEQEEEECEVTETTEQENEITESDEASVSSKSSKSSRAKARQTEDTSSSENSISVTIPIKKYPDDAAPGEDHIFTFELLENGKVIASGQNDAEGNVSIDIPYTFSKAGTYTYTVREINDGQEGIDYDSGEQTVTVIITEKNSEKVSTYNLSAEKYYGVTDVQEHYMSTTAGGTDIPVFCIDAQKEYPPDYSDLKTGKVIYTVITNPSNETLEKYVGEVKAAGKTEENLRKLLYYLDTEGKNWNVQKKNNYIWTATSKYNSGDDFWNPVSQSVLDKIYATTEVPDNYRLALFYPSGTEGKPYYSLNQYQSLILGYYSNETVYTAAVTEGIEFHNTTALYRLPETGGFGTTRFLFGGRAILASALLCGIRRKRERRLNQKSLKKEKVGHAGKTCILYRQNKALS